MKQKKSKEIKEKLNEQMEEKEMMQGESEYVEDEQMASLKKELEESKKQCADYLDKMQRTLAEFDNFRKRTSKEKATMFDDGTRETITKLLPIVDSFERALSSTENKEDPFYIGVEMIYSQLISIMEAMEVKAIEAVGQSFDPNFHAAVAHIESEEHGDNEIVVEMLKGYVHKDKVIRHSMVQVAN